MKSARLLVMLAGGVAAGACSLINAEHLDRAREAPPASGLPDGGGGASDAASWAPDGGGDASDVVPRGCSAYVPAPLFCDDFDGDGDLGASWDDQVSESDTDLAFEATRFSSPRSFGVSFSNAGTCSTGRLERAFTGVPVNRQEVRVWVHPRSTPWGTHAVVVLAPSGTFLPGECALILELAASSSKIDVAYLKAEGMNEKHFRRLDAFAPNDAWTEVAIVATPSLSGQGIDVEVTFTDANNQAIARKETFGQCNLRSTMFVGLGPHCSEGDVDILYDDVRIDAK
jgi:hypothetical protein